MISAESVADVSFTVVDDSEYMISGLRAQTNFLAELRVTSKRFNSTDVRWFASTLCFQTEAQSECDLFVVA